MIYFDTSYVVRLYFDDPGHAQVRELAATDHVACALHGRAEAIAAFHRKFREGVIRSSHFQALLKQFAVDNEAGAIRWLPSGPEVVARLEQVYTGLPATVYLRAADAVHLATAALHNHKTVYSNDAHLLGAAKHFGLTGKNVIPVT